jgi:acyl-CoA synthetase (AMP-forming)/AMP-acid ligase II
VHFAELVDVRAVAAADARCISDDAVALNNGQFAERVRSVAGLLAQRGVRRGDVVATLLPNRVELVLTLFAAWRLGAAVTPINPALTDSEAAYQLEDSATRLVVLDNRPSPAGTADALDVADLWTCVETSPDDESPVLDPDGLALLIYTSGTTGKPKGVMLDHANLTAMCEMALVSFEFDQSDHCLLVLPLFHVNGIVVSVLTPLLAGASATIAGRFSPDRFFADVERCRPTYFSAVPAIYAMLSNLPESVRPDTSSLRFVICGAAPMPAELIERFERRYGVVLVEGYGLSEGTCASTVNPLSGVRKPGTVGLPMPGQRVELVDPDGNRVPPGESGEVVVAGPNVMRGYLNRPGETAKTVVDGWLHTGDVGRFDEDGYLVLVDRVKDMIIRDGENIYPKEIESVLYQHPSVLEVAVVGRPHEVHGEVPVGYVSLRDGPGATVEELLEHAREHLSKYKVPVELTLLESLPKNSVGKIDKPTLRSSFATTV